MKITRRQLMQFAVQSSSLMLLPHWSPAAFGSADSRPQQAGRFFVHLRTLGGMDSTLGLDPLTHADYGTQQSHVFIEYRPEEILRQGQISLGPAAEPIKKYADQISLIRGFNMRQDVQHEPMNDFWVRATLAAGQSAFAFKIAQNLKSAVLSSNRIPNMTRVSQIPLNQDSVTSSLNPKEWELVVAAGGEENRADLAKEGQAIADSMAKIETSLEELPEETPQALKDATIAARFMADSVAVAAVIDINFDNSDSGNLDTHNDHESNHVKDQKALWQQVADIFERFHSTPFGTGSLFDVTTFIVTSEFSRTPFLNSQKGKDHNIETNAALICGPDIRGGQVVGASRIVKGEQMSSRHVARPFDFKAGRAMTLDEIRGLNIGSKDIGLMYPEDVMTTVSMAAFGSSARGAVNGRLIRSLLKG